MDANPGDLVQIVDASPRDWWEPEDYAVARGLRLGRIVMIIGYTSPEPETGEFGYRVAELPLPADEGWDMARFRKLNDEPDNAELIALIKRPVRRLVSA